MPIRADLRRFYGSEWKQISRNRRERAGWRCEWCRAENGQPNPATGSRVVLTVAHLNHDPCDNRESNLAALCQRCHLAYDVDHHRRNAAATRRRQMLTADLFEQAAG